MLDPEALRPREIGDDPYRPTRPGGQKAGSPFATILANRRRIGVAVSAARYRTWPKPTAGSGTTSAIASGRAKAGPIWRCGVPLATGDLPGRFLLRELKRDGERPRPEQLAVVASLRLAGVDANFWWQADWPEIEATLQED